MESYFYCKYGGIGSICSDCKRNPINSPYKIYDIKTWLNPSYIKTNGTTCTDYIPIKKSIMVNKQEFIDKACEWLTKGGYFVNNNETIEDFRKAMEE